YASFADGDTPVIINGEAKISGLTAQLTENPFDPEMEEEDYLAWTPEVESFSFPVPVKGVPAVEEDEFVTMAQLNEGGGGLELIPFSTVIDMDGNYRSQTTQTGPIAITKGSFPSPL